MSAAEADAAEASFLAPFERVFATLKRMASNYATLAVLDAQRSAVQFAWLVAGGIFVSVLVVTAWLAVVVAAAVWLLGSGMSWPAVLLIAAGLNLVGAMIVGLMIRGRFDSAPFAATLRQIKAELPAKERKCNK
jgi:ribose/xylose/arabinose/galactoside ABC-type transport system permease subunit